MKICGITAEYNPFHSGHIYQISETKKKCDADLFIVVMSGNFVQRGEPACIDKFARAEAAVRNGIDAVIELPYYYAVQSASRFAHGAVTLLKKAGVSYISFGSECANLENLKEIASTPVNPDHLHVSMDQGMSFPKAYSLLTASMMPNDILAVSYLREIEGTDIQPILIPRTTNYLDETMHDNSIASALAIRKALKEKKEIGNATVMKDQLEGAYIPDIQDYYPYLRTFLLTSDSERLSHLFLFNEGIENLLVKNAADSPDWNPFLHACTTHRYTSSRIRRSCIQALVQFTKEEAKRLPEMDTLRILAFNNKGRQWLHSLRKNESIHIASRFADVPYPWRKLEYRSTLAYTSVFPENKRKEILQNEIGGAHYVRP